LHRCLPKCTKIAPETHQKSPVDDEMLEGGWNQLKLIKNLFCVI
jgi:hypothetical protein